MNNKKFLKWTDIHTHSVISNDYQAENGRRTNTIDEFIEEFKEKYDDLPDVISFTDHNVFSKKLYNRLVKEFGDEKIFFPGIEINFKKNDEKFHCVILINPSDVDKFISFLSTNIKLIAFDSQTNEPIADLSLILNDTFRGHNNIYFDFDKLIVKLYNSEVDFIVIPHSFKKDENIQKAVDEIYDKDGPGQNMLYKFVTSAFDASSKAETNIQKAIPILFNLTASTIFSSDNHDLTIYPLDQDNKVNGKTFVNFDGTFEDFKLALTDSFSRVYFENEYKEVENSIKNRNWITTIKIDEDNIIHPSPQANFILGSKGSGKSLFSSLTIKSFSPSEYSKKLESKNKNRDKSFKDFEEVSINSETTIEQKIGVLLQNDIADIQTFDTNKIIKKMEDSFGVSIDSIKRSRNINAIISELAEIKSELENLRKNLNEKGVEISDISKAINVIESEKNLNRKNTENKIEKFKEKLNIQLDLITLESKKISYFIDQEVSFSNSLNIIKEIDYSKYIFENKLNEIILNQIDSIRLMDIELRTMNKKYPKAITFLNILMNKLHTPKYEEEEKINPYIVFRNLFAIKKIIIKQDEIVEKLKKLKANMSDFLHVEETSDSEIFLREEFKIEDNFEEIIDGLINNPVGYLSAEISGNNIRNSAINVLIGEKKLKNKNVIDDNLGVIKLEMKVYSIREGKVFEFEELSPGQKMEALLNHLFNNYFVDKQIIFIDQPEDNLDSKTIEKVIVNYIRKHKISKQFFIVTHSSQLLLNSDPNLVILPSIDKQDVPKLKIKSGSLFAKDIFAESISFTEGSISSIKERYQKIHSMNIEEWNENGLNEYLKERLKLYNSVSFHNVKHHNKAFKKLQEVFEEEK